MSGARRLWIDVPYAAGEWVYRLFATTPSGYAGALPASRRVQFEGAELPGLIPTGTFDAAYGGGVLAVLSRTATGYIVATQRVSAP